MALDDSDKGKLWRLPVILLKEVSKAGHAFSLATNYGIAFYFGLVGDMVIGPGVAGLQLGFRFRARCGFEYEFEYGAKRGESPTIMCVWNLFKGTKNLLTKDEIGALRDKLVLNSKKLIIVTTREIEKWKR